MLYTEIFHKNHILKCELVTLIWLLFFKNIFIVYKFETLLNSKTIMYSLLYYCYWN